VRLRRLADTNVSVLLPVGGESPYLASCLDALAAEIKAASDSGVTCETVIVLDRAWPTTERQCEAWAHLQEAALVLHSPQPGLVSALNYGLEHVSGTYTSRIDSDDLMLPGRLTDQVRRLDVDEGLVLVGGQMQRLCHDRVISTTALPISHTEILRALLAGRHAINHSSITVRTSALRELSGYWQEGFGEDWDIYLRLARVGQVANLSSATTAYRFHSGSISAGHMTAVREGIELALLNNRRWKRGQPLLSRRDLTWRRFLHLKLRARRNALAQTMYRRHLCTRSNKVVYRALLIAAGLLEPGTAISRVRADRRHRSRPLHNEFH